MNSFFKSTLLVFLASFVLVLFSCSNSSGGGSSDAAAPSGGETTTTPTTTGTDNGGGTQTPTPVTYTITFNANNGSENPTTATQTFTVGTSQALKTIAELGFSKNGFNFAGWGTEANATTASYSDGAAYTATADATLYALWSAVPVYSVKIPVNEHGTVTATPATAPAGTEITLSVTPSAGYKFISYNVTAADGSNLIPANGKFTMPEQNVTVTASFNAINYSITCGTFENGTVTASATAATVGTEITLTVSPSLRYICESISIRDASGNSVATTQAADGTKYTFIMPASNVTVSAVFKKNTYTISIDSFENGSITANSYFASEGTEITLSINPANGYKMESILVTAGTISITVSGNGNARTFIMPAQNVIVVASFKSLAACGEYTVFPKGTDGCFGTKGSYATFGLWPQTIKSDDVEVNENDSKTVGMFNYYKGSDGEWYVKVQEKACAKDWVFYSNGVSVQIESANSYKYFKVEPIKWRVINSALLLAENVLDACVWSDSYISSNIMTNVSVVNPNNYNESRIRAFLNGIKYNVRENFKVIDIVSEFDGKGFFQTAFEREYTGMDAVDLATESLLLNTNYGFLSAWNNHDDARKRKPTDYAKACGAPQGNYYDIYNLWWTRELDKSTRTDVACVSAEGKLFNDNVKYKNGVVPLLLKDRM